MHQLLQLRATVQAASGHACTVESFLGGGGQGEVYRANLDGKPLALKWYFPEQATPAQRQNLETLIRKGPPNGQFLWPLELATSANAPGFGYLMPLREPLYPHHLDRQRLYNLSQPLAAVQRHPQNPNVRGLNNLSPVK